MAPLHRLLFCSQSLIDLGVKIVDFFFSPLIINNIVNKQSIYWFFPEVDQAVAIFNELESLDPFRLNNLDTYSNLLYVKEMRVELSHLAHRVVQVDKYRVETCCVIGKWILGYTVNL